MWGTFPEEVTLTRLMLAQSSNMVRPQGPCARFPMEVAAFPGRGDGLELQIGISPATEKPGPEVLRLVPISGTLAPALQMCLQAPPEAPCAILGLDVNGSSAGRTSGVGASIPSF